MKKLFLSSAGLGPETKEAFLKLLGKDPKETKIAFIPTASDKEENTSYVDRDKSAFLQMGFEIKMVDLKNKDEEALRDEISDCDVIFVEGGNTYYLLDQTRKSGFDKVVKDFIEKGKIYFGVSAGTYIACPTIEHSGWRKTDPDNNEVKLEDLTALNLVPFIITAHYNRAKYQEGVEAGAAKSQYPVVALYDTQAILVEDNKYKVVGTGPKEFFNGFKERLD